MKKRILISFIVLAIVGITGCAMWRSDDDIKIKVKCHYMAYACGNCFPDYKIKAVIEGGNNIKDKLIGRDVKIVFKSKELDARIDSITAACATCYDYYFEGNLIYQSQKHYSLLETDTCIVKLTNSECCDK